MMFDFNYCNFDINEDEEWFKRQDWTTKQFFKETLIYKSKRSSKAWMDCEFLRKS